MFFYTFLDKKLIFVIEIRRHMFNNLLFFNNQQSYVWSKIEDQPEDLEQA